MRQVWIDTDPAIGVPRCDVDDGLALIQAFHSPELRVRGVSVVFGNAPLATAYPLAREIVERFGPTALPVHAGAGHARDLGQPSAATRALAAALEDRPLSILAIGPLTNVASLLQLRPDLASRIDSIVMVAGRRPGQRFLSSKAQPAPFPDFNFECDPEAMRVVLASPAPLVFAPWELSSHVWITGEDLDRLAQQSPSGAYIAGRSRSWLEMWEVELGAPGFNPFDTLAVGALTHPQWIEGFGASVWIEAQKPEPGSDAEPKPHLLAEAPERPGARSARYCARPHADFKPMLLERLARPSDTGSRRRETA